MGNKQTNFNDKYEEYMQNFLCRLLRHDFVVSYINDFFNQNERTYYSFFMLMKVLGAHKNLKFQTNYWSDCYIYFYEKLGIHGILFIPLLLSKGSTDDKKKIIKKYLNEHINNTRERIAPNSNLVINLIEFKKVILTYISCVSTRGLENVIKAIDNDPKESSILKIPEIKTEIKSYRILYSNQLVESFVDVLLRPYSRQNYYINAGKFIDDNIDFLTDDKKIRLRLREFSLKQREISETLKKVNSPNTYENETSLNGQNIKNENEEDKEDNNNTGENIKSSKNNIVINEGSAQDKVNEKNGVPLITESERLNEPLKTIDTARKGMLEKPNNNIVNDSMSNKNNRVNVSFQTGDWDVRNENSIKRIETNSTKNQIIQDTKNNLSLYEFEESFREENVPKKI